MKFSLPMIVGNLFQQAYTIVDSAIVGHYNGEAALAAVLPRNVAHAVWTHLHPESKEVSS